MDARTPPLVAVAVLGLLALSGLATPLLCAPGPAAPSALLRVDIATSTAPVSRPVIGLEGTMTVGEFPSFLAEDTANGWMYVTNEGSATVSILDGTHVLANVSAGAGASGIAYDPLSQFVYVADTSADEISVIDGTTNIGTIPAGHGPCAPVFDPEDGWVYVPNQGSSSVTIVNGTSVVATAPVGNDPIDATYDPANGTVYITNEESDFENILSGTATVDLAPTYLVQPFATVYDPVNGDLYVTNLTPNDGILSDVTVLNGSSRLATFVVGPGPSFPAVNTSSGEVYLPSIGLDAVQVLNTTSIVASIYVGGDPSFATYDPENELVYVTDDLTNDVTVLDPSRVLADVPVGANPTSAAFDPKNGFVYVAERGNGEAAALGPVPGWSVNFTESGLPSGAFWSVTVKEVSLFTNSTNLLAYEANGSYAYQVGNNANYRESPDQGEFNVSGNPIGIVLRFSAPAETSPPGFLGLPNPLGAVLLGTSLVVVVGLIAWQAVAWRRRRRDRVLRG